MKNNKTSNKKPQTTKQTLVLNTEKSQAPKNSHTALFRTMLIIINLVGFPLLILFCALTAKEYNESGIYKFTVFAPVLVAVLMWGLTALLQFIIFRSDKKKHRSFKHTMLACTAIPICCLSGLFVLLDIILPKALVGATSGTILYEDIVVDAHGKHEHILSIAQKYLDKNNLYEYEYDSANNIIYETTYEDGTPIPKNLQKPKAKLDANGNKIYKHWFSEENQKIFKPMFQSFDQAYQTFNGLAIEYALSEPDLVGGITSGKIPITVLMTIILKTSEEPNKLDVKLGLLEILSMNSKELIAAVKTLINSGLDFTPEGRDPYTGLPRNVALDKVLKSVMVHMEYDGIRWNVLQLLGENPISNVDPNEKIVRYAGTDHEEVLGAGLGYQDMAWLNSVDLLGIIICLLDCRKYFYIFGTVIGLLTFLAFVLKKQYLQTTGLDLTLIPRSQKRMAKEETRNWHFSHGAESLADLEELQSLELNPKKDKKNKLVKDNTVTDDKKTPVSTTPVDKVETTVKPVAPVNNVKPSEPVKTANGNRPINQPIKPNTAINRPINPPTNKPNAPINRPMNQSIKPNGPAPFNRPMNEPVRPNGPVPFNRSTVNPVGNKPVAPTPSVRPTAPVKPTETVKPNESVKPTTPVDKVTNASESKPATPVSPTTPAKPVTPNPVEKPTDKK